MIEPIGCRHDRSRASAARASAAGRIVAALALVATVACAALGRGSPTPDTVCYPNQCFLNVQNDNSLIIAVRYYDSTGAGDLLGSVDAGSIRRFVLPRRTSRTVTVEVTLAKDVFRMRTTISMRASDNRIHFPTDFEPVPANDGSLGANRADRIDPRRAAGRNDRRE